MMSGMALRDGCWVCVINTTEFTIDTLHADFRAIFFLLSLVNVVICPVQVTAHKSFSSLPYAITAHQNA